MPVSVSYMKVAKTCDNKAQNMLELTLVLYVYIVN